MLPTNLSHPKITKLRPKIVLACVICNSRLPACLPPQIIVHVFRSPRVSISRSLSEPVCSSVRTKLKNPGLLGGNLVFVSGAAGHKGLPCLGISRFLAVVYRKKYIQRPPLPRNFVSSRSFIERSTYNRGIDCRCRPFFYSLSGMYVRMYNPKD